MTSRKTIRALAMGIALTVIATSATAVSGIEAFYGEFEGQALMDDNGDLTKRDLRVKISPHPDGFTVEWTSVTRKHNGTLKRKKHTINFLPTRRQNIFRSGERKDMFGNAVPLDPLKGDPYVWARLHDDTLTVFALHVLEDGGYEMQTYARTRIPEGLDLQYARVRDGEVLRTVNATLLEVR